MRKHYVDYEIACLLKRIGFQEATNRYFNIEGNVNKNIFPSNWNKDNDKTSISTLGEAKQWLREIKNIHIAIDYFQNLKWVYSVCRCSENNHDILASGMNYKTYEDALLNGIKDVLKNILK